MHPALAFFHLMPSRCVSGLGRIFSLATPAKPSLDSKRGIDDKLLFMSH